MTIFDVKSIVVCRPLAPGRRTVKAIWLSARDVTNVLIAGRIGYYVRLHAKCCVCQAAWRGALARTRHHRVGS